MITFASQLKLWHNGSTQDSRRGTTAQEKYPRQQILYYVIRLLRFKQDSGWPARGAGKSQ